MQTKIFVSNVWHLVKNDCAKLILGYSFMLSTSEILSLGWDIEAVDYNELPC